MYNINYKTYICITADNANFKLFIRLDKLFPEFPGLRVHYGCREVY